MISDEECTARSCKRAEPRESLFLLATICRSDGTPLGQARIRNLSADGAMADFIERPDTLPALADRVALTMRGVGEVGGEIVRVDDLCIGVLFDRKINPADARRPVGTADKDLLGFRPVRS